MKHPKTHINQIQIRQFSHSVVSNSLRPHEWQHARPPCPSPTPGVYPNSCPSSRWCHPAISPCCPLLLLPPIPPSIRVFSNESTLRIRWPKYWNFSFSIIPSNEYQDWSPLGWTGWISLQSKGLSRVFSNTTVQKHQLIELTKVKHKEQILKAVRGKQHITHKGILIRITADLSRETLQARREWQDILKIMKENNLQPRLLYPARISFRYEGEFKSFTDKQKLREFSTTKPALQQMLKDLL